ncbi:bifunctional phosphopantothenoylcysteine decarboxylase/phosphopantothenate synthase [Alteraurantiacibacter aestuarii]|uniref:Coenzyme A biosynthesis bifunctional protein CoaBC n=1 Tax=Alteraurantiacibacter aestuarii TaxID=650004 RepID=A0A844ZQP7_9SPHN|nr:bifunctional phosphopantothenoylcysteine decarboxylase/phosphopantothenate synthase [Alteraurantiacibacter aestuarii]MXO89127.1 bifunctional phosphopantothenoylcysteine decarboxylase/phosphopantothenate synthase [Alteraurantiacibacter aestuarii]
MANPRVLLVVGGGIAAYKSCELVRLIRKGGADVTCVLTNGGSQFVTPMSLAALSGNQVHTSLWDLKNEAEIGHIQLSREADLVVVCPATADLMAKMAAGIADDLGTTLILATDKPVLAVPAMNVRMWEHEATQRNIAWLIDAGVRVMQPDEGEMACGEFGPGRLPDPEMVWLEIADMLGLDPGDAGHEQIADYLRKMAEAEVEDEDDEEDNLGYAPTPAKTGGLGGLIGSLIQRSTPRRIEDDETTYEDMADLPEAAELDDGEPYIGPDLPEPDLSAGGPVLARKGAAAAAPPTDREAINHEVNARQAAPQPFDGEDAAAPVGALAKSMADPLDGQPAFDEDPAHRPLYGKHVLITAGPTHEPIDPVRYLANRSSGRQGFAIAEAAAAAGARVTLVAGPVHLDTPPGVDRIDVESAEDMAAAVKKALPADCAIMVAAVADWRTRDYQGEKIKKRGSAPPSLMLTENPDILAMVSASSKRPDLLIGFAAETENVVENARKKRKSKGVDWIVANDVSGDVMGGTENKVHIIRERKVEDWDQMSKMDVAWKLVERIADHLNAHD